MARRRDPKWNDPGQPTMTDLRHADGLLTPMLAILREKGPLHPHTVLAYLKQTGRVGRSVRPAAAMLAAQELVDRGELRWSHAVGVGKVELAGRDTGKVQVSEEATSDGSSKAGE